MTSNIEPYWRLHRPVSRRAQQSYGITLLIVALAFIGLTSDTYAQQNKQPQTRPTALAAAGKTDPPATAASKTKDNEGKKDNGKKEASPASSEREKELLDRIEQLEKRLADVESRLPDKPDVAKPQPAVTAAANASPAAAS